MGGGVIFYAKEAKVNNTKIRITPANFYILSSKRFSKSVFSVGKPNYCQKMFLRVRCFKEARKIIACLNFNH